MRRLAPHLAPLGYSPRRYLPLSPAPVLGMGERLTDLRDIQQMFANGEQGGYWPADPAYAYEDSEGTTAASVNGVVGIRYDMTYGLKQLGTEIATSILTPIIVNYTGSVGTWTAGTATMSNTGASGGNDYPRFYFAYPVVSGKRYLISGRLSGNINKLYFIRLAELGVANNVAYNNTTGVFYGEVQSAAVRLTVSTGLLSGETLKIESLSIKEVLGNHAIQATTGNKPYYRRTPTTNKPWYDSNTATGALNVTFASALGSACTVATVTPEGVSILESQTVGTTYNICPPFGYNSDVLIINRALTAAERALVMRVMQRSVPALGSELVTNGGFDTVADGVIGHDNGDGTVDGFSRQNDAYLSVVDGKLNVNSATSKTLCACWLQLAAQSANAALFIKAKMELKTGSNIYGFMVIRANAPYTGYLSIFTSPSVINSSVIIPVSDISRIAFYATYYDAVNQTITVDDISAKVIL